MKRRNSLADDLCEFDDVALRSLLRARPDLARPAATDLTTLAARAVTPASLRRALDALDTPHLRVVEAVAVLGPVEEPDLAAALPAEAGAVTPLVADLESLALVRRTSGGLVAPGLRDTAAAGLAGRHPADTDIDLPEIAEDENPLAALTHGAPEGAASILGALRWGPSQGVVDLDGPFGAACRWLAARGLLRVSDTGSGAVVLPRPVALALRRGRLWREDPLTPPQVRTVTHAAAQIDAGGGVAAGDLLALVETIARAWGETPPRVLRSGGLAVRDLAAVARLTECDRPGVLVELLVAAGLVSQDHATDPAWTPTTEFDEWLELPDEERWAALVVTWRDMMRAPHRVGTRGADGTINALTPGAGWGAIPVLRRQVLGVLADLPPGAAVDRPDARALLAWAAPRLDPSVADEVTDAVLAEADLLGITSAGALTTAGRRLLDRSPDRTTDVGLVADAVVLPAPVTQVIYQADLTAVAPGRATGPVARVLTLSAELESRGAASVFRFTPASVRRAFDAGWSLADLRDTLARAGATDLPQPLHYLLRDTWRTHGRARIGAAGSYLTSNDAADLDALLARPEAAAAGLRRLAPTVVVSGLAPNHLLAILRDLEVHALLEGADGSVVSGAATAARSVARRHRPLAAPPLGEEDLDELVSALRVGEERRRSTTRNGTAPDVVATDPAVTLARLREAAEAGRPVWIGVVGPDGATTHRHVRPTRIAAGLVHATDVDSGGIDAWSLSRITGVTTPP